MIEEVHDRRPLLRSGLGRGGLTAARGRASRFMCPESHEHGSRPCSAFAASP